MRSCASATERWLYDSEADSKVTALARRYSELVLASGQNWKPEYTEELQELNRELTALRKEMKVHE